MVEAISRERGRARCASRTRAIGWLIAWALLAPAAAGADDSYAYDLAGELMSPFCPGRTLASCPSPQAGEMIQDIQAWEAEGKSQEEVIAILESQFRNHQFRGAPPAEGMGLVARVGPVVGFLVASNMDASRTGWYGSNGRRQGRRTGNRQSKWLLRTFR